MENEIQNPQTKGMATEDLVLKTPTPAAAKVERLFPFVLRARVLFVGQRAVLRSKSRLQFVLITKDISDRGRWEALRKLKHYPVVQCLRSADIARHFGLRGVKLLGFRKSGLSQSLYAEWKQHRINKPLLGRREESVSEDKPKPSSPSAKKISALQAKKQAGNLRQRRAKPASPKRKNPRLAETGRRLSLKKPQTSPRKRGRKTRPINRQS